MACGERQVMITYDSTAMTFICKAADEGMRTNRERGEEGCLSIHAFLMRKWFVGKQYSAAQKVKKVQTGFLRVDEVSSCLYL